MHNPFTSNYNQSSNHVSQDTELSNNAALMSTMCVCVCVFKFYNNTKDEHMGSFKLKAGMSEPARFSVLPGRQQLSPGQLGTSFYHGGSEKPVGIQPSISLDFNLPNLT